MKKEIGKVFLVGAGPGDPGLLTLKAKEILEKADIVFYDNLVHPQILEYCPQARTHYVGKVGYGDRVAQNQIEEKLWEASQGHGIVVRLKGGDPFIFGRGGEEAEFLQEKGVSFEVIPGVTSATAVPTYAGIPLTHRYFGSSVSFVTGHEGEEKDQSLDWEQLARTETLVFLMVVHRLSENFKRLIEAGKDPKTPAALIEWGTYPRQRTLIGTLSDLPEKARAEKIEPPAIAVVGKVVRLRKRLQWFEQRPLVGRRILVTRAWDQIPEIRNPLFVLGAEVLEMPTLEIYPPKDLKPLEQALQRLGDYNWVLFTSVNGVDFFFQELRRRGGDVRSLHNAKIVAVGPATRARLESLGLQVDRQPQEFTTEAMAKEMAAAEMKDAQILFPRAAVAREEVIQLLESKGAKLSVVPVYEARCPTYTSKRLKELLGGRLPDLLTFASSSTVKNFSQIIKGTPYWKKILEIPTVVIGPVTSETAEQLGFKVVGMPEEFTIPGLVQEVLKYFGDL